MIKIKTPLFKDEINDLKARDKVLISGEIYTGRDGVLPKLTKIVEENNLDELPFSLEGIAILHTAVSNAGISPTSSNKPGIESSIVPLSNAGVKIHIGKGKLSKSTIDNLKNGVFIITPSVAGLLTKTIISKELVAYPEEGIEAIYKLKVKDFPGLVAVSNGESIF